MKTVGILTYCVTNNYGTALQCFALKRAVELMGDYEVHIIPHAISTKIENGFAGQELRERFDERIHKFDLFLRNVIGCHEQILDRIPPEYKECYDYYIVGSDTVWNTDQTSSDASFFLDFVSDDRVRIAYAPSTGTRRYDELDLKLFQAFIPRFDWLSVREESDIELISQYTEKPVKWVLDPTLLIPRKEYEQIEAADKTDGKYILLYLVYDDTPGVYHAMQFANRVAREMGGGGLCILSIIFRRMFLAIWEVASPSVV